MGVPDDDPDFGRRRVVIEHLAPAIDGGRFPIKRVIGEPVVVELDAYADGHDAIACVLRYRKDGNAIWSEMPMKPAGNDRWRGTFTVDEIGTYRYTAQGWVDAFRTWRHDLEKRVLAGQDLGVPLQVGARLVRAAAGRAKGADAALLARSAELLEKGTDDAARQAAALDRELAALMDRYPDRSLATAWDRELGVVVDRERARFSAWYEFFPRSCTDDPRRHGRLRDCEARLRYAAEMGFDIVYLPPVHPVGETFRKGKNNREQAEAGDVGSPWAIGAAAGGHRAVHPELGTLDDFKWFVGRAKDLGLEVALDIAYQCSPDHPYVKEHPEWFLKRPDGSIQYAENPPKKYQDIYPIHFESEAWPALWEELTGVVLFWMDQGVRIFRVDNPHTKPFAFWESLIARAKARDPEVIFLSEAFTRPKVMYRLAKLGFTQSYTYFTWRNTKWDLTQYFTELTRTEVAEFFRPSLWPNTPDILNEYLQVGGRPAFMVRLALAATLGASYGIYGPAFELMENRPREPGSEEYLDSEKYQIRVWPVDRPDSLRDYIARVNRVRRENRALQADRRLRFHFIDNDMLIAYSKATADLDNVILVVVNLDPHHMQSGWVHLPLADLGLDAHQPYQAHDLLSGARYLWTGERNFVQLDPHSTPAHIFRLRKRVRSERDFDYYM
ncbi:alpha-1,4-glucan--maltose-1-phosphate maltosyltransferase [Sulfurifustis variabilis]|uniref:alpha-1,4-glucan--maltose-1-phosphate maltosyltransferase n=1 Tax=Sulfurifustis variabilis TaxID=1675686 RepID=UPI000BBAFECE